MKIDFNISKIIKTVFKHNFKIINGLNVTWKRILFCPHNFTRSSCIIYNNLYTERLCITLPKIHYSKFYHNLDFKHVL